MSLTVLFRKYTFLIKKILLLSASVLLIYSILKLFDNLIGLKASKPDLMENRKAVYMTSEYAFIADTNSKGFRGKDYSVDKPENSLRILAIGDSFTYGWGVDIEYTWPFLLEKKLSGQYKDKRVEVINLGVGGAVPSEYSEIAEEYILLYKPDFVIVGFVEGNDFAQITTSVEKGKKVISSETTVRRQKLLDELADSNNILDKRIRINNFIRSVFPNIHKLISKRNTIEIRLSFIEKMRKYILQLDDEDIDELNRRMNPDVRKLFMAGGLNPYLFIASIRTPDYFIKILESDDSFYQNGIDEINKVISNIKSIATANNAEVTVLDIPYGVFVNKRHMMIYREMGFTGRDNIWTSDAGESITVRAAETAGVDYLKTLDVFRKECMDDCFFKYDDHMTPKGYRILSDAVFEKFITLVK